MERTGEKLSWRWLRRAVAAVARHPALWLMAVQQVFVLAVPGWWRRWPPLPVPDEHYLRFRLVTMYGDSDHSPEPDDVIAYLKWCKSVRGLSR